MDNNLSFTMEILEAIKIYSEHVDAKFAEMDERFDRLERTMNERFDRLEARVDRLEQRLDKIEERLDKVEQRLDKVEQRLDKVEISMGGLVTKRQFNSLLFIIENEGIISDDQVQHIQKQ